MNSLYNSEQTEDILNEYLLLSKNTHYNSTESKLGLLGEIIVKHIFNAEMSEDLYDSSKDMTAEGLNIEVKTQARWKKLNCFTIWKNQNIRKCLTVDKLIFVEPGLNFEIRVFECLDRTTLEDDKRFLFPVKNMLLIRTIIDETLNNIMINLAKTEYRYLT